MMMWFVITEKNLWRGEVNQTQALDTHPVSTLSGWASTIGWSQDILNASWGRMGLEWGTGWEVQIIPDTTVKSRKETTLWQSKLRQKTDQRVLRR